MWKLFPFGLLILVVLAAQQKSRPLDAHDSDPVRMGWMQGQPPPPEKLVRWNDGDHLTFPKIRWSASHFNQLMPTKTVARTSGPVRELPASLERMPEIDAITYGSATPPMTWSRSLGANYTDGIIILHKGRVVYERYFGVLTPEKQHAVFSVTKSFTGVIAGALIQEGELNPDAQVGEILPELRGGAASAVTVRQLLDMTSGLQDPDGLVVPQAVGLLPRPAGYTGPTSTAGYLSTVKRLAAPGTTFEYKSADADILAWVLARVTGKSLSDLYRERLWIPLQKERDGYFTVDSEGFEFGGGGLNATLRDVARFGEMVRLKGQVNGKQVIPEEVFTDIHQGGNRELYKASPYEKLLRGWSYRSFWWVSNNADGAISAIGIHGQNLFINPKAEMVIVRLASHPDFMAGGPVMRAYDAVAQFLNR